LGGWNPGAGFSPIVNLQQQDEAQGTPLSDCGPRQSCYQKPMLVLRMKLLFAVITLIVAAYVLMEARAGADIVWAVWLYPVLALGFGTAIVIATLSEAARTGPVDPARLVRIFASTGVVFPVLLSLFLWISSGLLPALLGFLLTSGLSALFYLVRRFMRRAANASANRP
jgi:hypothetical protein